MTDDSYAKNSCGLLASEEGCWISSLTQATTYDSERTMRYHVSLHKSSQYYVTRAGVASKWKTCTATATATTWNYSLWSTRPTHMSSWCGDHDDDGYVSVKSMENVHSRNIYMSLSWRRPTLNEYDLVQQQHVEVWWWTDQYEGNVRTVWRKCRTTFTIPLLSGTSWHCSQRIWFVTWWWGVYDSFDFFELFLVFSVLCCQTHTHIVHSYAHPWFWCDLHTSLFSSHESSQNTWTFCNSHLACRLDHDLVVPEESTLFSYCGCGKVSPRREHKFQLVAEQSVRLPQEDRKTITLETPELRWRRIVWVHRQWTWDQKV